MSVSSKVLGVVLAAGTPLDIVVGDDEAWDNNEAIEVGPA